MAQQPMNMRRARGGNSSIPTVRELSRYNVIRRDSAEGIKQTLYDFQIYPAAGTQQLQFFQVPRGQGTGVGGGTKTYEDTNMDSAGLLPNPKNFLIQGIELVIIPSGTPVKTEGTTPTVPNMTNDMWAVTTRGYLELFISSKSYLIEAPLLKFPARNFMRSDYALSASNGAGTLAVSAELPTLAGSPYALLPPIRLEPTMNFSVTLNWSSLVPTPSTSTMRIGVVLSGILYRNSQ